jgi:hypothetical protein
MPAAGRSPERGDAKQPVTGEPSYVPAPVVGTAAQRPDGPAHCVALFGVRCPT